MDASRLAVLFAAAGAATLSALTIRGWAKRPLKRLLSHKRFTPPKGYKLNKSRADASRFLPSRLPTQVESVTLELADQKRDTGSPPNPLTLIQQPGEDLQKTAREITIEYRKSSGEISQRVVTAYSRNLAEGRTHSINCRQAGERITKMFLLNGIQSISLLANAQAITVRSPAEIEALINELLPLKDEPRDKSSDGKKRAGSETTSDASPALAGSHPATIARVAPLPPPPPALTTAVEQHKTLANLLPTNAKGFAILDLKTTGKESGSCRIIEIALIKISSSGRVTEQWETLVNPGCSFDNHAIHGISESMARAAPTFDAIAPLLAAKLDGHVLVAHDLYRFDGSILERYFKEVQDISIDLGSGIDTMPNPRRELSSLCDEHGVNYDPKESHTALGDVRALSTLVPKLLQDLSPASQHVVCASNPQLATQVSQGFTRSLAVASSKVAAVSHPPVRPSQPQSSRRGGWRPVSMVVRPGLVFVGTQNKAASKLLVLKQSEDHLLALGLRLMVKRARIIASDLPDFVLAPSLEVTSTKMKDAIRLNVPVVLCSDARQAKAGGMLTAWLKND